jgi:hypothetical protein
MSTQEIVNAYNFLVQKIRRPDIVVIKHDGIAKVMVPCRNGRFPQIMTLDWALAKAGISTSDEPS